MSPPHTIPMHVLALKRDIPARSLSSFREEIRDKKKSGINRAWLEQSRSLLSRNRERRANGLTSLAN